MDALLKYTTNQKFIIKKRSYRSFTSQLDLKNMLLAWCRNATREYPNVNINDFTSSWSNGLAFCALVHRFIDDSFNFNEINPNNPRDNFEFAFNTAKDKANIESLIDVDDMIMMPIDSKCVMLYVSSFYNKFK